MTDSSSAPGIATGGVPGNDTADPDALALGVDIGGTKIAVALVDGAGRVRDQVRIPTQPELGAAVTLARAREAALRWRGEALAAVGVSVAGQVLSDGTVAGAPNLGWVNEPVHAMTTELFGLPAHVANDVHAAAWAEWRFGAGRGSEDLFVLFIGTGVGGCSISGGRLLLGASGSGGEVGHLTLVSGGHPCRCRHRGCIEAYLSGWAIERDALAAVSEPSDDPSSDAGASPDDQWLRAVLARGGPPAITAEAVRAAQLAGDPTARQVIEVLSEHVGAAVTGLVNAFNPAAFVMGGGVVIGFPELVDVAAAAVREHSLPAAARACRVLTAALPADAPVVGVADMASRIH